MSFVPKQSDISQIWDVANLGGGSFGDAWLRDAPQANGQELGRSNHFVQFYETDAFLLDVLNQYIGSGIRGADTTVVIATEAHRQALEQRLLTSGLDLQEALSDGRYVPIDAASTAASLIVDGSFDAEGFEAFISEIVGGSADKGRRVRFFGEIAPMLIHQGKHAVAVSLERFLNELQSRYPFSLLCAYQLESLGAEAFVDLHAEVCSVHAQVYPSESYLTLANMDERMRALAILQQKSQWLESEIASRQVAEEQVIASLAAERAARQEAIAALRARDDFVAIAAHDLRTPLATLSAHAQLALRRIRREGKLSPEESIKVFETITAQSATLARLVDNLLNDSRLERGGLPLDLKLTDLSALVTRAVVDARMRSDHQFIHLDIPSSCMEVIDELRIDQVLTNLLDNAIRYGPIDRPIEVVLKQSADQSIELSVRDFGPGIRPELRPHVFERFFQVDDEIANGGHRGLGLGLYICNRIVDLHGGEIRAEFPDNGGTRMMVRLPQRVESSPTSDSAD